jgi:hypothetical protein
MNKELKAGIIYLIIGLLISINPWFWFFTWPLIIFGTFKIWKSKSNLKLRLIWTFVPFIFWIPLVIAFIELYMENKSY